MFFILFLGFGILSGAGCVMLSMHIGESLRRTHTISGRAAALFIPGGFVLGGIVAVSIDLFVDWFFRIHYFLH